MKLPEPAHSVAAKIFQAYESDAEEGNRPHLGASLIGHACERYLWMTFRWVYAKKFPGRMLRLFETGQREESRLVANLRRIGVEVHDTAPDGSQWRVSALGGHFGGSMDGAAVGLPEAPKTWHVLEFKTHNDKSFADLLKNGVAKAKPQHFAQMQTYMGLTGMERAFYMAVNKNNDDIYTERVEFDQVEFAKLKARAERVINANEPPLRCSNDPSWYVCKMCDFHGHCHNNKVPDVNCRTCAHSTPEMDGDARWSCAKLGVDVDINMQRSNECSQHRFIPVLLQNIGDMVDVEDDNVKYEGPTGVFFNGDGDDKLSSLELRAMDHPEMAGEVSKVKLQLVGQGFPGKVAK